jgi:multidrug efflux system membrane fusion protein
MSTPKEHLAAQQPMSLMVATRPAGKALMKSVLAAIRHIGSRYPDSTKVELKAMPFPILKPTLHVLLIAAFLAGCSHQRENPAEPLPVTVQAVHSGAEDSGNLYSGSIVADTQVDVSFKVNGYVQSILKVKGADGQLRIIQAGDYVASGSTLASIKDDTYRQQVLKRAAELKDARAEQTKAKADFDRYSELFNQHVISAADYDTYKQKADSSQAAVAAAQAALQGAQVDLDDCKVKSPISGSVLDRKIEVGTLVAPNSIAFQVADTKKVKVVFGVPGSIVSAVGHEAPITMITDGLRGQVFNGSITKIASAADSNSRLFDIEATIPNDDNRLRVGMIATLHLPNGTQSKPMPVVPMRSIVRPPDDPKGYAVYVVEDKDDRTIARLKPIAIGTVVGDEVSVASGVNDGSNVIVNGSDIVYDGEPVSVVP